MIISDPKTSPLKFDESSHRYLLDGKPVPSVTRVVSSISEDLMLSTPFIRKTAIGTNVHKICEMINNGDKVNISALSQDVRPYVDGYNLFLATEEFRVISSEMRVFSSRRRFAGTLDIIAKNKKGELAVLDIKTSAIVSPTAALQLSAYMEATNEMQLFDKKIKHHGVIWLTGDGGYELIMYKDTNDYNVFLCKLVSLNWDVKMGLK